MKPEVKTALRVTARRVERARRVEDRAWEKLQKQMKDAYDDKEDKTTLEEIGQIVGVTKARVYQIVTGKRSSRPSPSPTKKATKSKSRKSVKSKS